jgi:hypothetical protein
VSNAKLVSKENCRENFCVPRPEPKAMSNPAESEGDLLRTVLSYLKLHRILHMRLNAGGMVKKEPGGAEYFIKMAPKGWADILAFKSSKAYAIELKGRYGEQSQQQRCFQSDWEAAGHRYILARSVDEVIAGLR